MAAQKQKLILHIGLHKTGTSYIQQVLATNIAAFAAAGAIPAEMFNSTEGQHHKLAKLLLLDREDEFFAALGHSGKTTLVTSEALSHWFGRIDDTRMRAFAERLEAAGHDVRIVMFIRRQDFLKESVFAEVATSWYRGPIEREKHYFYDFNKLALRLETAFGHERIAIGLYRDDRRTDLMAEFLRLAELDLDPAGLVPVPPQRVSMGRRKVALLAGTDKKNRRKFRRLRKAVIESPVIVEDGIKYQMSPEARLKFLQRFKGGNRDLARRFGFDAEATGYLLSDAPHPAPWAPLAPFSAEEMAVLETVDPKGGFWGFLRGLGLGGRRGPREE